MSRSQTAYERFNQRGRYLVGNQDYEKKCYQRQINSPAVLPVQNIDDSSKKRQPDKLSAENEEADSVQII